MTRSLSIHQGKCGIGATGLVLFGDQWGQGVGVMVVGEEIAMGAAVVMFDNMEVLSYIMMVWMVRYYHDPHLSTCSGSCCGGGWWRNGDAEEEVVWVVIILM